MSERIEVDRRPDWEQGEVACDRCGDILRLMFNGGELDRRECSCGREWRTEHVRIDLVVYERTGGSG